MITFRNRPIRHKLMLITMMTSCLALLLASSAFVIYEQFIYREKLSQELDSTAGIIGDNCASALSFDDPGSAERSLQSLSHQKSIVAAAVYDSEGNLFAEFHPPEVTDASIPLTARHNLYQTTRRHAERFRDIELAGDRIGSVYIRHDMAELHQLQRNYLVIAGVILLVVSTISWMISSRLQRVVSEPVASLAEVVAHVARTKDYSVRAVKQSEDELGQLIDGFNEMLLQIQQRDAALELAQNDLENRVQERTSALAGSVSMLHATLESTADGILAVRFSGEIVSYNSQFALMWRIPTEVLDRGDEAEFIALASSQLKDPERFIRRIGELFVSEGVEASEPIEFLDGRIYERHVKPQRVDGRNVGMVINFRDVTDHRRAEEELRWKTAFLEAQSESSLDGVLVVDRNGQRLHLNRRMADLWNAPQSILDDSNDEALLRHVIGQVKHPQKFIERVNYLYAHPDELSTDEIELIDGRVLDRYSAPVLGRDGTRFGRIWSFRDITGRKRAEAETEHLHRQLVSVSRQAGMSEVATSVLHNVGNVLNSVNVASTMLAERLRKSKLTSLSKVADLLRQHEGDLAVFLTTDEKGRQLSGFLAKLAAHLSGERESSLEELAQLQDHIEHIKDIVNMQQGFAKVSGVTETLLVADLVEDALKLNSSSLVRHEIVVIRDYQDIPAVTLEKHKVLQILVNLVRNAKQACEEAGPVEKFMTLRISSAEGRVSFAVSDNGVGIAPENLTRIFAHGFTTKPSGHGFGLHSAALAAGEMGGSLTVHSDGPGRGATFTLELPFG